MRHTALYEWGETLDRYIQDAPLLIGVPLLMLVIIMAMIAVAVALLILVAVVLLVFNVAHMVML